MKPAPDPVPEEESPKTFSTETVPAPKRKRGRPKVKTSPERTINISVPEEILEKMNVAKRCYDNNLTAYVNALIKADLDAKYDSYVQILKYMDNLH